MMGLEILARSETIKLFREACKTDHIFLSTKAQKLLLRKGLTRKTAIDALMQHIDEKRKIHAKSHDDGDFSYHGSLLIHAEDQDTVYFELKLPENDGEPVWFQLHEHPLGYKPLCRKPVK
jgi:hypothetical protein